MKNIDYKIVFKTRDGNPSGVVGRQNEATPAQRRYAQELLSAADRLIFEWSGRHEAAPDVVVIPKKSAVPKGVATFEEMFQAQQAVLSKLPHQTRRKDGSRQCNKH